MATAKQIAARKLFAQRARSGAFKRKRKSNPASASQDARRPPAARASSGAMGSAAAAKRRAEAARMKNPRERKRGKQTVRAVYTTRKSPASTVTLFHLVPSEPSSIGAGEAWSLPEKLIRSRDFQAWAYGMAYVVSASRTQLRARLARFV